MSVLESTFLRMFGRPTGMLGKLGGIIMARMNAPFAHCVIRLLDIQPGDKVLEIGFGPGVGIQLLAKSAPGGRVAGVDCSREMVKQATARNAEAIERGVVDLRHGSVEKLPFEDSTFDAVVAINSMQVWPDVTAGLREARARDQVWWPGCAGLHPVFRPVQGRDSGTALGCWFRRRERGGDEARILRPGT